MNASSQPAERKLYWIIVKVRPTVSNPDFLKIGFGYLIVCLLDRSDYAAAEFAETIVKDYPFEIVGETMLVWETRTRSGKPDIDTLFDRGEAEARRMGMSVSLAAFRPGTDDSGFETEFENNDRGF